MSSELNALPGFEEILGTGADRAGAVDLRDSKYTATNVLKQYPGTFKAAAAAIFKYNLPNRVIRELFQMNGNTVNGIRELVLTASSHGSAAPFLLKCRAASSKSLLINRLLDQLHNKLDDEKLMSCITIDELLKILDRVEKLTLGQPVSPEDPSKATIDVPPSEQDYDSVVNGLTAEKNRARLPESGFEEENRPAESSMGNDLTSDNSLQ